MDFNLLVDFLMVLGYELVIEHDKPLINGWFLNDSWFLNEGSAAINLVFTPDTFYDELKFIFKFYDKPCIYNKLRKKWIKFPKDELEMEIEKIIEGID